MTEEYTPTQILLRKAAEDEKALPAEEIWMPLSDFTRSRQ